MRNDKFWQQEIWYQYFNTRKHVDKGSSLLEYQCEILILVQCNEQCRFRPQHWMSIILIKESMISKLWDNLKKT